VNDRSTIGDLPYKFASLYQNEQLCSSTSYHNWASKLLASHTLFRGRTTIATASSIWIHDSIDLLDPFFHCCSSPASVWHDISMLAEVFNSFVDFILLVSHKLRCPHKYRMNYAIPPICSPDNYTLTLVVTVIPTPVYCWIN